MPRLIGETDTESFVNILFDNLDTNGDGKISFEEFQGALLLEPKLARCFVPTLESDNTEVPERDRNVFGLLPLLSDDASSEAGSSVNFTEEEKTKTRSQFNSRSELLDSLKGPDSHSIDATSSTMVGTSDSSCCVIS